MTFRSPSLSLIWDTQRNWLDDGWHWNSNGVQRVADQWQAEAAAWEWRSKERNKMTESPWVWELARTAPVWPPDPLSAPDLAGLSQIPGLYSLTMHLFLLNSVLMSFYCEDTLTSYLIVKEKGNNNCINHLRICQHHKSDNRDQAHVSLPSLNEAEAGHKQL